MIYLVAISTILMVYTLFSMKALTKRDRNYEAVKKAFLCNIFLFMLSFCVYILAGGLFAYYAATAGLDGLQRLGEGEAFLVQAYLFTFVLVRIERHGEIVRFFPEKTP